MPKRPQPQRWIALFDRLVPPSLRGDPGTRRRALLAIGFVAAIAVVGAAMLPLIMLVEDPIHRMVGIVNTIVCVLLMGLGIVMLRRWSSLWIAGNWLCLMLFAGLVYAIFHGGGVRSPFTGALVILPVLGFVIAGRRSGLAWGGVCVALIAALTATQALGLELPDRNTPVMSQLLTSGALAATVVLITWMSSLSESMNEDAIARARATAERLAIAVQEEERARTAADQAIAASEAKSAFLATMSHELRTPLNAILGYSELVLDALGDRGEAAGELAADIQRVHSAGRHLLGLITDVLDLTRIEAARMDLSPQEFDPAPMLRELADIFRPLAERSNDKLRVEAPPSLGVAYHDATRLRQVVINLIGNAIKFTRRGTITLRGAEAEGGWLELTVEDTGIGIPENKIALIFEPFTQVDASTTRRYEGTGLGLAVCRKLVALMGGSIVAHSEIGRGSSFMVRLPRRYSEPQRARGA